jgi:hypothetical protein
MSKPSPNRRHPLKHFEVPYCVEEGYVVVVKARDAADAQRIVDKRLEDEGTVLKDSTCVHSASFTLVAEEVEP